MVSIYVCIYNYYIIIIHMIYYNYYYCYKKYNNKSFYNFMYDLDLQAVLMCNYLKCVYVMIKINFSVYM